MSAISSSSGTPFEPGLNPRESGLQLISFEEMFGDCHPVILEIGSGKGRFLVAEASGRPDVNLVGIEKSLHFYRVIRERLLRANLPNVRIINHDAFEVLKEMIPSGSVSEIHVYFPDPWPRPRERKRRLIREEVLAEFVRVLVPGGWGTYVTDHQEYFRKAVPVLEKFFSVSSGEVTSRPPRTNYEAKYMKEGRSIYEATFQQRSSAGQ